MDRLVIEKYDAVAPRYERRWARYLQETLPRAERLLEGASTLSILDVSCGTGALLERLMRLFPEGTLVGLDGSWGMVRQAHANVSRQACPPTRSGGGACSVIQGLADHLTFRNATFDRVVCTNAFHYFRHPLHVLQECRRVLRPSGVLVLLDWCGESWHCRLIDGWLRLVDRTYVRMYTRGELHALLVQAGFVPQRTERFRVSWAFGWKVWDMMLVIAS